MDTIILEYNVDDIKEIYPWLDTKQIQDVITYVNKNIDLYKREAIPFKDIIRTLYKLDYALPITIGYVRDDGDLAVISTLNNSDQHADSDHFMQVCDAMIEAVKALYPDEDVIALNRCDTPDYVEI